MNECTWFTWGKSTVINKPENENLETTRVVGVGFDLGATTSHRGREVDAGTARASLLAAWIHAVQKAKNGKEKAEEKTSS